MIQAMAIIIFVLLFAAFPLAVRENKRKGGCGFCAVKKALGLCDGDSCPVAKDLEERAPTPGGRNASHS